MSYGIENVDRSLNTADARRMALTGSIRDFQAFLFASSGMTVEQQGPRQATSYSNAKQQDTVISQEAQSAVSSVTGVQFLADDNAHTLDEVNGIDEIIGTTGVHGLFDPVSGYGFIDPQAIDGHAGFFGVDAAEYRKEVEANEGLHKALNSLEIDGVAADQVIAVGTQELMSDAASALASDDELSGTVTRIINNSAIQTASGSVDLGGGSAPAYDATTKETQEAIEKFYRTRYPELYADREDGFGSQWLEQFGNKILGNDEPEAVAEQPIPAAGTDEAQPEMEVVSDPEVVVAAEGADEPIAQPEPAVAPPSKPPVQKPVAETPVVNEPVQQPVVAEAQAPSDDVVVEAAAEPEPAQQIDQPVDVAQPAVDEVVTESVATPETEQVTDTGTDEAAPAEEQGPSYYEIVGGQLLEWGDETTNAYDDWVSIQASIEDEIVSAANEAIAPYKDDLEVSGTSETADAAATEQPAVNDNAVTAKASQFA